MIRNLLLPLLFLATGISSSPYGYQYQLPKEHNSYSHGSSESYSQLEPFRRFLKNYMSSQDSHPYQYMKHPMANVQVRSEMPKPSQYHRHEEKFNMNRDKYMVGEMFFKNQGDQEENNDVNDRLPYNVLEKFQNYETRYYPSATYVCNKTMIDTAADPLAGLERMNPYEVMSSKRYHKRPASQMFRELFRYIQGENQEKEKVEMTSPVVVFHKVTKETTIGDYEEVEMCFYLPHKYQENHEHLENQRHHDRHHELNENHEHNENQEHPEDHEHKENQEHHAKHHENNENHEHIENSEHPEDHVHQDNTRHTENHEHNDDHEHPEEHEHLEEELGVDATSFRHAKQPPPQPMENGRVYLYKRPAMKVYVRTFGGFALTHQTWETQRELLEDDLLGKKYNNKEYFTASYDNPWKLGNKRNEVWIKCLEPVQTLPGELLENQARRGITKHSKLQKKKKVSQVKN